MVNKEIARQFNLLANLMELHGENAFKTKAYANAFLVLRKWDQPLEEMSPDTIDAIPGIGSSAASKIKELISTGSMQALEILKAKTPEGIQQLLSVKGLGPKKIKVLWDELKIESPAELLYACDENRLVQLSGFGLKTQEDLRKKIEYFLDSQDRYLYGNIEDELELFFQSVMEKLHPARLAWVGDYATKCPVVNKIECLIAMPKGRPQWSMVDKVSVSTEHPDGGILIRYDERFSITIHQCTEGDFYLHWCRLTMNDALFAKIDFKQSGAAQVDFGALLKHSGFEGLPAELMDKEGIQNAGPDSWKGLITAKDLKGILHNHSTWSDGIHTLEEMALYVRDQGYAYFAICDHSRSAFYAKGLSVERVEEQMAEIDRLNVKLSPFKIFKGIESDILGDGSLDYEDEVLKKFDLVVASVHSNLRMDETKAMSRLIRAIENPFTRILGHPTGRLLLARQGYPIDHRRLIDACAANGVAIELNANPLRMEIDYAWIPYCMEKNVLVSINPDAHSRSQVGYVKFGVFAARKGGLKVANCLNAFSLEEFNRWIVKTG